MAAYLSIRLISVRALSVFKLTNLEWVSRSHNNDSCEFSHAFPGLLVRPRTANLLKPLQTQRPEVEVRIAKAF